MTLADALADTRRRLEAADVDEASRTAAWLVEAATGTTRTDALLRPSRVLSVEEIDRLDGFVVRRVAGEPVQYVTGEAAFRRLALHVAPGVLIPRPETEELVDLVLDGVHHLRAPRLLDAGTGSGCIALALRDERPDAIVDAFDVSDDALVLARANAERLGGDVAFHRADLLAAALPPDLHGPYDALVSNPPYIPDADADSLAREVVAHEPALALFSGPDPLTFYRALARHARAVVRPGGLVAVEVDDAHAQASAACFGNDAFEDVRVHSDLYGRARFVTARRR